MTKIRMFTIRGLLGGEGFEFSEGMDVLASEARKIPNVAATSEGEEFNPVWGVVGNLTQAGIAAHKSGRELVYIGHSYGGYAALVITGVLAQHGIKTRLTVCVDTTIDSPQIPNTGGERWVYFQKQDPMGGGNPDSIPNGLLPVKRTQLAMSHIAMASATQIHSEILKELQAVAAS